MSEFAPIETTGIQAKVEVGELDNNKVVRKVSAWNLPLKTQTTLLLAMDEYRHQLKDVGILTPKSYKLSLTENGIETVDEFIEGGDVDYELKQGRGLASWEAIVRTLCALETEGNQSKVMIDAKPANWIVNGGIHFIDLYPPMLRDTDGNIYPFIPEVYNRDIDIFNFNCGDTRGQITKLLAGARFTYPKQLPTLEKITRDIVIQRLSEDKISYIDNQIAMNYPDMNALYGGDLVPIRKLLHKEAVVRV